MLNLLDSSNSDGADLLKAQPDRVQSQNDDGDEKGESQEGGQHEE